MGRDRRGGAAATTWIFRETKPRAQETVREREWENAGGMEGYVERHLHEMAYEDEQERRTHQEVVRDFEREGVAETLRELQLRDLSDDDWAKMLELNLPPPPAAPAGPTIAGMFDDEVEKKPSKPTKKKRSPRLPGAAGSGEAVVDRATRANGAGGRSWLPFSMQLQC